MPEDVPVKGRNKSVIVASIKILDTAASGAVRYGSREAAVKIFLLFYFFDGNNFTGKAFDFG